MEFASFSLLAFHFDRSVHHPYDKLRDGHSKTRSFNLLHFTVFSGESLEYLPLELLRHADTIVFHTEMASDI